MENIVCIIYISIDFGQMIHLIRSNRVVRRIEGELARGSWESGVG